MKNAVSAVLCIVSALLLACLFRGERAMAQEGLREDYRCDGLCHDVPGDVADGAHFGTRRGRLTLRDQLPERVSGTYIRDGMSLDFEAGMTDAAMSLALRSGSGEVLLDFRMDLADGTRTAIYLGGRLKVQVDAAFVERLQAGGTRDAGGLVVHGDEAALGELKSRLEYRLLAYLSRALGQQGITGNVYPATLSLHTLGMRVAGDLGIMAAKSPGASKLPQCGRSAATDQPAQGQGPQDITTFQSASADSETDEECRYADPSCDDCRYECSYDGWGNGGCGYYNRYGQECDSDYCDLPWCNGGGGGGGDCCSCEPDLSSDPCGNDCLGMCGDGCNCWPWVCGDCAYHWGCDVHDHACRDCHESWGLNIPQCAICYTPLAVVVAKFGC